MIIIRWIIMLSWSSGRMAFASVRPNRPHASRSSGGSVVRATVTGVLGVVLVCCLASYMGEAAGRVALEEQPSPALGKQGLSSIISSAEEKMNNLRHTEVAAPKAALHLPVHTEDLLKLAKTEQGQKHDSSDSHSGGLDWQDARDENTNATISSALADMAKQKKEHEANQKDARQGWSASGNVKEEEEATDFDHGRVSKAALKLAVKLQAQMKQEGDEAREESIDGGGQSRREATEAKDEDHGTVSERQYDLFKHALREQEGKWDMDPSKVEQEAEMEQHADTMLASEHERN